ncbi:hypothetical protein D3C73_1151460 [compost metagenome]
MPRTGFRVLDCSVGIPASFSGSGSQYAFVRSHASCAVSKSCAVPRMRKSRGFRCSGNAPESTYSQYRHSTVRSVVLPFCLPTRMQSFRNR